MRWKRQVLVAVALVMMPTRLFGADGRDAATESDWLTEGHGPVFTDGTPAADGQPLFLTRGQSPYMSRTGVAARFGWWFTDTEGDLTKIDEYEKVEDSPFWDVDGITSDGFRTFNFYATGTEREGTDVGVNFYGGPGLSVDFDYLRYYRRLDHLPLTFFDDTDADGSFIGALDDLNTGDTYAIRVQKLEARFKGRLTENIRWGLNVWGLRKHGERQQNAMNHNCSGQTCHLQTQRQKIDWLTMEIEPTIEISAGPVVAEYSRTMRAFNQYDGTISRSYTGRPVVFEDPTAEHVYGVVPENYTQIDRLKLCSDLSENNHAYANLFIGDTENQFRNTHRSFWGTDLRLTNRSIAGLSVTPYFKYFDDQGQKPTTFPEDDLFQDGHKPSEDVRAPVDREWTRAGIKGRWYPLRRRCSSSGLSLSAGYEYEQIERANVRFSLIDELEDLVGFGTFTQPTTISNMVHVGAHQRWTQCCDSFVRYKMRVAENPMFGFRENQEGESLDDAVNTNQPEHEDLFEIGGTWTPAYNFLVNATFGFLSRHHSSPNAYFDEDDYPFTVTGWYAPTPCWSFSAGYANFSNFVSQDITIGTDHPFYQGPGVPPGDESTDTTRWNYRGEADVVNFGASFAASRRLTLSGSIEYARSQNIFADPSIPGVLDMTYVVPASDVLVETWRLALGVDYCLTDFASCYFHYNYFDYDDKSVDFNSGTANMFLVGGTAVF